MQPRAGVSLHPSTLIVFSVVAAACALSVTSAAFQRGPLERREAQKHGQLPANPAALAPQERLKRRAGELYSLMQLGHWEQAEAYIAPDSLENFRKQPKSAFLGFKVDSVNVDADGQSATVAVQMQVVGATSGVVAMPQTSRWRFINQQWYLVVPDPADQGKNFREVFSTAEGRATSAPEELKFKGHRYELGKIEPTEVSLLRFPFTNVADHVVTLTSVQTFCPCLQAKIVKKEFKPGESGDLEIDFNPKGFEREYEQTIVVKTDPGDLTTHLTVMAFVIPPAPEHPKRAKKGERPPIF